MADTSKLRDMLDNIVDGNAEDAQIDFHEYLRGKMQDHLGTGTSDDLDELDDYEE